ncbi:hypothetical protein [Planctomicrobium piriforme]|uniref:Uncharacterized protein n=1 Tax=Planctomicrobium piriforme TaxID=1576369 RepID=A0A1I3C0K7_9PLAN|nr:hypothetical protein [Planctomicrobium piriforme]SFH67511.1 hypothetical protein SAMN05421753_1028 [Planctomicrobium piriforme]
MGNGDLRWQIDHGFLRTVVFIATQGVLQPHARKRPTRLLTWTTLCCLWLTVLVSPGFCQPAVPLDPAGASTPVIPATPPTLGESSLTPGSGSTLTPEIPEYHLTQVHLDADVGADRVNLVATIELMINRGEGWHRVPLRLGSAHVTKREYSGTGEESPDVTPRSADEGLVWLFKGLGRHQIKLHAWIPYKPAAAGGQFQLSLPRLPPQFEARIKARIPDPNAVVRSTKTLTVLDITRTAKETVIDASVVGNLLLFAWQTPSAAGETISLVQSWFHLKPAAEHLSLVVEQNFELQQTTADSLLINLPTDFRLAQLSGSSFRAYEQVPDRPGWVRVYFTNDNLGRLHLRWVLERDFSQTAQTLEIEGFHVEGAVREEGLIRIDEFENLRIVPRPADSPLVHRIGVNQVRSLGSGVPLTAYEYLKQPFRLTFDIQPMAPYFLVEPKQHLHFESDAVELTATSAVRIERGAISELKLHWPHWLEQGWRVQSVNVDSDSVGPLAYDATSQPGTVRLWWPNALNQDAVFTVLFRRPVSVDPAAEDAFRASLQLPVPLASELAPAMLQVDAADQLSVELLTKEGEPLPRATVETASTISNIPGASTIQTYRIEDLDETFVAKVESHQREVTAVTEIAVHDAAPTRLAIEQTIELNVTYGRVRTLELVLPPELMAHIPDWAVPQGIDVTSQGQKLALQQGMAPNVLKVDLGQERIGRFKIEVAYGFPVPAEDATRDVDLPVIALNGVPFGRAECLIDTLETLQVRPASPGWEALQTSPSQARWINPLRSGPLTAIPLTMGLKLADSSQQYVVQRMQVRTIFAAEGIAESWAEFQLDSPPTRVVIQFPPETEFKDKAFLLDGKPLPRSAISQRSGAFNEITLTLPPKSSPHPRIAVRYRTPLEDPFGLTNRVSLPLPQFPRSVWVDETVWEMQLPEGQHLFTYPELLPQIQWVRHFLFWYREPTRSYLERRDTVDAQDVPAEFRFPDHHFYAFRGFGPVQQIEFQVMNRSLILLLGAGFTLLLGFVFWRVPATRNVFSLIVICFLFAAASLWYVEPILLLLQPAILGVVLALTATMIDSTTRPRVDDQSTLRNKLPRLPDISPEDSSPRSATTRIYRPVPAGKPREQD